MQVVNKIFHHTALLGLFALIALAGARQVHADPPQRWALLVGVAHNINPDNVLYGPDNDVAAIKDLLRARYDFSADHIDTVLDERATRNGILDGWNWLIQHAHPGDLVFFYYSGHGIDVPDSSRQSGRDSAICPYDAAHRADLITGSEIGRRIDQLSTDHVVAIVDACCSETSTRDIRVRKRSPNPATLGLTPAKYAAGSYSDSETLFATGVSGHPQKECYIGAARIDQCANECDFLDQDGAAESIGLSPSAGAGTSSKAEGEAPTMGALTFYLLKELRADPSLSYTELTRRVTSDLAVRFTDQPQQPNVSGPGIEGRFLSLAADVAPTRVPLDLVAAARSAGGAGSSVALHPIAGANLAPGAILQTTAGSRRWTEGDDSNAERRTDAAALVRVTTLNDSGANGVVLGGSVQEGATFTEVMHPSPDSRLLVAIDGKGPLADRVRAAVAALADITVVPPTRASDVTIYPEPDGSSVDLVRRGVVLPPMGEADVPAALVRMQRVKVLADLHSSDTAPVHVTIHSLGGVDGFAEAKIGGRFGFQISVDRDAYITILDIAADGTITGAVLPGIKPAGAVFTVPASPVDGPAGLDTIKVIATQFPVSFSLPGNAAAIQSGGEASRPESIARTILDVLRARANSESKPLIDAVAKAVDFTGIADGAKPEIATGGWATADFVLRINP